MTHPLTISASVAAVGALAWYVLFTRMNQHRAMEILDRVRLAWRGRLLALRWRGSSRLHAGVQIPSSLFYSAHITLRLLPRPNPLHWLVSRWRHENETVTIETDLDQPPNFSLEVHNHRWRGQTGDKKLLEKRKWTTGSSGPIVLASCDTWDSEHNPVLTALLVSRESDFVTVKLRPQSPHLTATMRVEALPDHKSAVEMLSTLRDLASGTRIRH